DGLIEAMGYCHYPTLVPSGSSVPGLVGRRLTSNLLFEVVGTVFADGHWQSPTTLIGKSYQAGRNGPIAISHSGRSQFYLASQVHAVGDEDVFRWRPPVDSTIAAVEVRVEAGNGAPWDGRFATVSIQEWTPTTPPESDSSTSGGRPFF